MNSSVLILVALSLIVSVYCLTAVPRTAVTVSGALNGRIFQTLGCVNTLGAGWQLYRVVNGSDFTTALVTVAGQGYYSTACDLYFDNGNLYLLALDTAASLKVYNITRYYVNPNYNTVLSPSVLLIQTVTLPQPAYASRVDFLRRHWLAISNSGYLTRFNLANMKNVVLYDQYGWAADGLAVNINIRMPAWNSEISHEYFWLNTGLSSRVDLSVSPPKLFGPSYPSVGSFVTTVPYGTDIIWSQEACLDFSNNSTATYAALSVDRVMFGNYSLSIYANVIYLYQVNRCARTLLRSFTTTINEAAESFQIQRTPSGQYVMHLFSYYNNDMHPFVIDDPLFYTPEWLAMYNTMYGAYGYAGGIAAITSSTTSSPVMSSTVATTSAVLTTTTTVVTTPTGLSTISTSTATTSTTTLAASSTNAPESTLVTTTIASMPHSISNDMTLAQTSTAFHAEAKPTAGSANTNANTDNVLSKNFTALAIAAVVLFALIIFAVTICIYRCNRIQKPSKNYDSMSMRSAQYEGTAMGTAIGTSMGTTMVSGMTEFAVPGALMFDAGMHFRWTQKIAQGGGGQVFLGEALVQKLQQSAGGVSIIVKIVAPDKDSVDKKSLAAFNQEVSVMHYLGRHRNVAKLAGWCERPLAILMHNFVHGALDKFIENGGVYSKVFKWSFADDVSRGLNFMHSKQVAHSDIKPANVLVDQDPETGALFCVLTDFGVSQMFSGAANLVYAFEVVNLRGLSLKYAAPEALTRFREHIFPTMPQAFAADVFAYSVLLFELLDPRGLSAKYGQSTIQFGNTTNSNGFAVVTSTQNTAQSSGSANEQRRNVTRTLPSK